MTSSEGPGHVHHLIHKYANYVVLDQACSDAIRTSYCACEINTLHGKAYGEWRGDPLNPHVRPPQGDQEKNEAFFNKCDSLCAMQLQNPHDIYKIKFACWAGMQVIHSQLARMPGGNRILAIANQVAWDEHIRRNAELVQSFRVTARPGHSHLQSTSLPSSMLDHRVDIGTTISYVDMESGKINKCTIQDYGTSQLKGDWVEVVYNDMTESRISQKEMEGILANRIQPEHESVSADIH